MGALKLSLPLRVRATSKRTYQTVFNLINIPTHNPKLLWSVSQIIGIIGFLRLCQCYLDMVSLGKWNPQPETQAIPS